MTKRGRPKKGQELGLRVPISLRVTPEIKKQLKRITAENGRSISQEIEIRLQCSFERQDIINDLLAAARGGARP